MGLNNLYDILKPNLPILLLRSKPKYVQLNKKKNDKNTTNLFVCPHVKYTS